MSLKESNQRHLRPGYQPASRVHLANREPRHAARRSPKHARPAARWRRSLVPLASAGFAAALLAFLLVGTGGPHGAATSIDRILDASSKLGPLSARTTLSGSSGHHREVQPLHFTEPPTTVVTHPTPNTTVTTVTTVTVRATTTTTVTRVTTVTVHPVVTASAAAPSAPTTTTTTVHTTTTTVPTPTPTATPTASANGVLPDAPAGLGAPTNLVLDDEFDTGSLNTTLWSPTWFANGSVQNGTVMESSNVGVGANGLALTMASNNTGAIVSSNPDDSVAGHSGFQIAPTPGKPVYVEFRATLPAAAAGDIADWPALWLDGQNWPEDGEIDVMEGLGGSAAYHLHYGSTGEGAEGPGKGVNTSPGTHTYGVLWTTTGVTFVYDGTDVGTLNVSMTSPMYLLMENSLGSGPTLTPATVDVRYVRVWQ